MTLQYIVILLSFVSSPWYRLNLNRLRMLHNFFQSVWVQAREINLIGMNI